MRRGDGQIPINFISLRFPPRASCVQTEPNPPAAPPPTPPTKQTHGLTAWSSPRLVSRRSRSCHVCVFLPPRESVREAAPPPSNAVLTLVCPIRWFELEASCRGNPIQPRLSTVRVRWQKSPALLKSYGHGQVIDFRIKHVTFS